jgi:thiol-disulfide isomerase/thioredoxin
VTGVIVPARRGRRRQPLVVTAAFVLAAGLGLVGLAACGPDPAGPAGTEDSSGPPAREAGEEAGKKPAAVPEQLDFTATTLDGKRFDGSTLAGKPVALWFWAPWCPLCRAEAPTVTKLAKAHGDQVGIVGVAGLDKLEPMRGFVADTGVRGVPHLADEEGAVWRRFAITTQSSWVMLDADGREVYSGRLDDDELTTLIRRLAG